MFREESSDDEGYSAEADLRYVMSFVLAIVVVTHTQTFIWNPLADSRDT